MDDLDKQLAELQLINTAELPPNPNVARVGSSVTGGPVPIRKIAPAVPPKPKKHPPQPQVPYSHKVQRSAEPLYSSRLPNASPAQFYSNLPPPPAPPACSIGRSTYANVVSPPPPLPSQPQQQQPPPPPSASSLRYDVPSSRSSYANSDVDAASNVRASNLSLASNSNLSVHSSLPASGLPKHQQQHYWNQAQQVGPDHHHQQMLLQQQQQHSNVYTNVPQPYHRPPTRHDLIYSNLAHAAPPPPLPPQQQQQVRTYGNIMQHHMSPYGPPGDDLPPPPPPPEHDGFNNYAPCMVNTNMPPPPDDLPPPPSPVSSSYSELRRATHPEPDYHPNYSIDSQEDLGSSLYAVGSPSQTSSTYESIYEPINPRPPSQLSSRSNYSLYGPYGGSTASGPSQSASRVGIPKERDVDTLTNLLVANMHNQMDPDFYGICFKCDKKVVGENSGCTAMDKIYHTACFTCHHCAVNLQGKPFYALDGKPYCEEDYLNTLEKCCVCTKPILDRILRATGKPYHPKCFCCVICGKSLDGIPFTVDSTNQIHCIEDFHRKFAPRCCVCKEPIMPEPGQEETVRVVALDRSFHIQCYKCEDCGLVLSSEAEGRGCYPLDDHVLCKSCNAKRVQALTMHMTTEL